jgi:nucleotide-binding universal stress UspA family protein
MAYKTILLSLNELARNKSIIPAVAKLAAQNGAEVIGLYVLPGITIYPASTYAAAPDIFDGNRRHFEKEQAAIHDLFEKGMASEGVSCQFQVIDSDVPLIAPEVIKNSRNAELLVISATRQSDDRGVEYDFVESVVMASGRPVLVLPIDDTLTLDFSDVLLAWNESRESSRAAFDALPFLQHAKTVHITKIDHTQRGTMPGVDIAETLARQGVSCDVMALASEGMTHGEALLRAAKEQNSGLVVMGAYGHSRVMEFVFGGATRHVIKHLDRPVLMSH